MAPDAQTGNQAEAWEPWPSNSVESRHGMRMPSFYRIMSCTKRKQNITERASATGRAWDAYRDYRKEEPARP